MGGGNVTVVGDWVDSFDARVQWSEQILDGWVEESGYSVTSMVVASTTKAFMTFSQSFVDMGLAKAAGIDAAAIGNLTRATQILKIQEALTKIGATFRILSPASKTIEGAIDLAAANRSGVVNFSIRLLKGGTDTGGHRLYVSFTRAAGLMIKDSNFPQKVFRTVAALREHLKAAYGADQVILSDSPILFIQDALLVTVSHLAQRATELMQIALPLAPLIPIPAPTEDAARRTINLTTASLSGAYTAAIATHAVARGENLSKIAEKHYGDWRKWSFIYAANAVSIGRNPNLIQPGQVLRIPSATA